MDLLMRPRIDYLQAQLPAPAGVTRDDRAARPGRYEADRRYIWSLTQVPDPDGDESIDRATFNVRIATSLNGQAEVLGGRRLGDVSDALDVAANDIAKWVQQHRQVDPYWDAIRVLAINYDAVIQVDVRIAWVDLTAYRFVHFS
jgi:hypothetical protein